MRKLKVDLTDTEMRKLDKRIPEQLQFQPQLFAIRIRPTSTLNTQFNIDAFRFLQSTGLSLFYIYFLDEKSPTSESRNLSWPDLTF